MSYVHPAWLEHQQKRFTRLDGQRWVRPDAHRLMTPQPPQAKSYAARVVEQRQVEEERTALDHELKAFYAEHLELRRRLADLKFELAWRRLRRKYSPDQARDEQGRWTNSGNSTTAESNLVAMTDGGGSAPPSLGEVQSDASPDPVVPGAQYAQTQIEIHPSALTGKSQIDDTTRALAEKLAVTADTVPKGIGPLYGTAVHESFKFQLRAGMVPGVSVEDVEPTFGGTGQYGSKGSIRPDVVFRYETGDIAAIYDVKTGSAQIRPSRVDEFRALTGVGRDVPIIELHLSLGVSRKSLLEISDVDGNVRPIGPATCVACRMAARHR
jgi:hypothetical protein